MQFVRLGMSCILVTAGAGAVLIAWANLYNIDYQDRAVLAAVATAGLLAIVMGVVSFRRLRRSAQTSSKR
jgi:hypothetical protein